MSIKDKLVAMRAQPSSSAYSKKNKFESLTQFDKLEKNDRDTNKDKQIANQLIYRQFDFSNPLERKFVGKYLKMKSINSEKSSIFAKKSQDDK